MVTFLSTIAVLQLIRKVFIAYVSFVCVASELLHIMMHYVMLTSTCTLLYAASAIYQSPLHLSSIMDYPMMVPSYSSFMA